jgi:hypothetical protein
MFTLFIRPPLSPYYRGIGILSEKENETKFLSLLPCHRGELKWGHINGLQLLHSKSLNRFNS